MKIVTSVLLPVILGLSGVVEARGNTPCSGSKGGVSHCSNGQFVCNDGSISGSTRPCSGSVSTPPTRIAPSTTRHIEGVATPPVTKAGPTPSKPVKEKSIRYEVKNNPTGAQYYIDEHGIKVQVYP
jgi:hypothetical protein